MSVRPLYISVDIETDGPVPGIYSMLSIAACIADDPGRIFYRELSPISESFQKEALVVNRLNRDTLKASGPPPLLVMSEFSVWIDEEMRYREQRELHMCTPVFVGLNAAFDWQFVNWYFVNFLKQNPFGHKALDINALYMGHTGCSWNEANAETMAMKYAIRNVDKHFAPADAQFQAQLFCKLLKEISNATP